MASNRRAICGCSELPHQGPLQQLCLHGLVPSQRQLVIRPDDRALHQCRLRFDLIFGTSTGSIIGAMLSLGKSVKEITDTYTNNVTKVMQASSASDKSRALTALSDKVFGDTRFEQVKTNIGIVELVLQGRR